MIDGIWWLVILLAVVAILWFVAHLRGKVESSAHNDPQSTIKKTSPNDALQKTAVILQRHFPSYRVTRRSNHLLLVKQDKKIAMITIDKNIAVGQRRLGEVPIINYHRVPNRAQLSASLQFVE
ncbi:hypothetical protein J3492_02010 [Psychrobacter sp. F1192]|uniref:DUF2726 domain-containing protein n=1 Tax=Psychrobacter coccoides TaxID=2818440 RepID=A0ABS3NKQ4_9GAMM|nr:hypothetical protein [Psychrobacter coccoides]MBO1529986.1 hypothetical protein [Psychrobacter coccoides]